MRDELAAGHHAEKWCLPLVWIALRDQDIAWGAAHLFLVTGFEPHILSMSDDVFQAFADMSRRRRPCPALLVIDEQHGGYGGGELSVLRALCWHMCILVCLDHSADSAPFERAGLCVLKGPRDAQRIVTAAECLWRRAHE